MTNPGEQAYKHVMADPEYEDGSPIPRTAADWRSLSERLLQRRDLIRPILEKRGIDPMDDTAYAHLLGELGMAERIARGMELPENADEVPDTIEGI